MAQSYSDQVKFARALVCPEKSVRDETCNSLTTLLSKSSLMSDMEMLKLWKALYYCLWLADKAPIQNELAQFFSGLFRVCNKKPLKFLFLRMFLRTMMREWSLLDQYRIEKFYKLIRLMLRECFSYLNERNWPSTLTQDILNIWNEEALQKLPNGVRFHIADIYLPELLIVTGGEISTSNFLQCIRPFLDILAQSADSTFHERVSKKVFGGFLATLAVEAPADPDIGEEEGNIVRFKNVNTKTIQAVVFDIASDEATKESNRRKVYACHQLFPPVTGTAFAENSQSAETGVASSGKKKRKNSVTEEYVDSDLEEESSSGSKKLDKKKKAVPTPVLTGTGLVTEKPVAVAVTSIGSKTNDNAKNNKSKSQVEMDVVTEEPETTGKKNKKTKAKIVEDSESAKIEEEVKVVTTKNSNKKQKNGESVEEPTVVGKKKGMAESTEAAPVAVTSEKTGKEKKTKVAPATPSVEAPVSSAVTATPSADSEPFIASAKFAGSKPGYVFNKGKSGLGYYLDAVQLKKLKKAEASTPKAKMVPVSEKTNSDRKVKFVKSQSKGYTDSVNGLKNSSPDITSTPSKSSLKGKSKK